MASPFPGMDPYLEESTIKLPILPIPLLDPDPDAYLDLKAAIDFIYERAGYNWRIRYDTPVPPPNLSTAMASWVEQHLAGAQKRSG